MLIDQELVVGAVDRVVQHGPVKPDLDILHCAKRPVQREGIADLGGHGVADAFFLAALSGMRPVRISERNPHADTCSALAGEGPEDPRHPIYAEAFWLPTVSDAARIADVRAHPWLALSVIEGEHDTHAAVLTEGPAEVLATVPEDVRSTTEMRNRGGDVAWATAWLRMTP